MDHAVKMKFLQVLIMAYELGEESSEITSEQVVREITPPLKALLADLQQW